MNVITSGLHSLGKQERAPEGKGIAMVHLTESLLDSRGFLKEREVVPTRERGIYECHHHWLAFPGEPQS